MKKILLAIFASCILATQAFAAYLPFIDDGGDTYVNNVYTTTVNGVIVKDHAYIYVKTTGDDTTGDGSGSKPFKTIQKAVDSLVDFISPNTIYIFVGSGTYTENVVIPTTITGSIMIQGDTTHPENVVVKSASAIKQVFDIGCPARVSFAGMKIQDATSSFGVLATNAWVGFYNVQFYNNKTSVSSLSGSRVSFLGSSLGVSTIDGNDIASSYGITSDSTSIINIAQNLVIDNVDYGILNQSSSAYISSNVTITAKKIVWWSDKGAYNYIAGTQTFTGGGSGSSIFKLGHSELDFVSATLNMSTADYGFYGETGVKISEVGGTFNYSNITKEVYLDYDTVLDTTDSLSATPEFYKAASDYGYDERYISGEQSTHDTIVSYIDQDVKTTARPTFDGLNISTSLDVYPQEGLKTLVFSGVSSGGSVDDGTKWYFIKYVAIDGTSVSNRVAATGITGGNNTVNLTFPAASERILHRKLYRSSNLSNYYLVDTITDNSITSYSDTKSNDSLGEEGTWLSQIDTTKNVLKGSGGLLFDSGASTTTKFLYGLEIYDRPTDSSISPPSLLKITGSAEYKYVIFDGPLTREEGAIDFGDDVSENLVNGHSGWGKVYIGDNEESADFSFNSSGVVTLERNTANVVNTDTDDKFCIYTFSGNVAFKNRLGSSKTVKYVINY